MNSRVRIPNNPPTLKPGLDPEKTSFCLTVRILRIGAARGELGRA